LDRCVYCKKEIPKGATRIMTIDDDLISIIHCCLKCDRKQNQKARRLFIGRKRHPRDRFDIVPHQGKCVICDSITHSVYVRMDLFICSENCKNKALDYRR